ncbi:HlyD family type I secretion periplasmic adaptor subunit [Roseovarius sp. SK2]|jgi:HlyD family type I secretion membrane fusion protein|uniref:HlyD family type I secretion periplasmic adaptor subunit n=1 Tax=Roseovarius TaxID=74030 RepID=UPI000CDE02CB|nr:MULTISPECIES: HlyD family type I secretion periplasmic adaptor subunit [Roseovarius]MDD9725905.1 HlyD family type I secretion periplasmic adaptor subunit [Roseovarius sp. SK2]
MSDAKRNSEKTNRSAAFDKISGRIVLGVTMMFGLLGGVGAWAFNANLTGAVIAMGTVKVDQNLKQVQHRDGGIVEKIFVREGDEVEAGQVLFRLDDAQSRAELSILSVQLDEAELRRARLIADRDGEEEIRFPERFASADPQQSELMSGELRLHAGNIKNRTNQREQLELSIVQVEEEIVALESQRSALVDELALVEESHDRVVSLFEKGLIQTPRVDEAKRELVQMRGKLGELDANIARSGSRISEIEMRILSVDEVARNEAQRELSIVETRIQELSDRLTAVQDRLSRTEIRAPISGRINELSVFTEGGVITPAEVLATIVPSSAELRIEVQLPTTSIDQVYLDQSARIRFSSFNHRTTPEILGVISQISPATTISSATGEPFYIGNVDIPPEEMNRLDGLVLLPGMPAEIYLSTQEQTAASYFARPLMDQFERAFREE